MQAFLNYITFKKNHGNLEKKTNLSQLERVYQICKSGHEIGISQ
jgi:hypothetical protein